MTDEREWMLWRRSSTEVGADGPVIAAGEKWFPVVPKARAEAAEQRVRELEERLALSGDDVRAVMDFLDSWRFCPVSSAEKPAAQCLEDAAKQLLDALPLRAKLATAIEALSGLVGEADAEHIHVPHVRCHPQCPAYNVFDALRESLKDAHADLLGHFHGGEDERLEHIDAWLNDHGVLVDSMANGRRALAEIEGEE